MLRGLGFLWDLEYKVYDNYNFFKFYIPNRISNDCYDRYLIRVEEMRESCFIIYQELNFLHIFKEV
jgi:NADH-quinone oxidoreductase subunit D